MIHDYLSTEFPRIFVPRLRCQRYDICAIDIPRFSPQSNDFVKHTNLYAIGHTISPPPAFFGLEGEGRKKGQVEWCWQEMVAALDDDEVIFEDTSLLVDILNLELSSIWGTRVPEMISEEDLENSDKIQTIVKKMLEIHEKYGFPLGKDVPEWSIDYEELFSRDAASAGDVIHLSLAETLQPFLDIDLLCQALISGKLDHCETRQGASLNYRLSSTADALRVDIVAGNLVEALRLQLLLSAQYGFPERLKVCRQCGRVFSPDHGKQAYCGAPCNKDMASKRRSRAKKAERSNQYAQESKQ